MGRIFKGRPVVKGSLEGKAIVSKQGLNTLATFQKSALKNAKRVIVSDQNNKDLYKKNITGKILCLPKTIGSTTGGMVLQTACDMGIAPKAMLFSQHIDSLAAAGVILAHVWSENSIVAIDQLGDEFLDYAKDDMTIKIQKNGIVEFL